ncbi:hypothetical protein Moror_1362 [Moniliophthora roreri MCA 2997]|nr:hypothetical protein Moror_1362 [Moniliophthora roreri MCA 2997]
MSEEGPKLSRSKLKAEVMEMVVASMVTEEEDSRREIKAMLPTPFSGDRKETKKFMQEVQLYMVLNPKLPSSGSWTKLTPMLAEEDSAKIPAWKDFLKDFKE